MCDTIIRLCVKSESAAGGLQVLIVNSIPWAHDELDCFAIGCRRIPSCVFRGAGYCRFGPGGRHFYLLLLMSSRGTILMPLLERSCCGWFQRHVRRAYQLVLHVNLVMRGNRFGRSILRHCCSVSWSAIVKLSLRGWGPFSQFTCRTSWLYMYGSIPDSFSRLSE